VALTVLCRNQIVGPSLFGIIYIKTVSTFPETIFYVCVAIVFLSLFFLFLVRIPPYQGVIDVEGPAVVDVPTTVMNDE
jgi:ATP/ADP translocase